MPKFEVTMTLGTTQVIEAESIEDAIDIVKHDTEWSQCDIDSVHVEFAPED